MTYPYDRPNVYGSDSRTERAPAGPDHVFSAPASCLGEDDYRVFVHPDDAVMGEGSHRRGVYG
jgi:hypothetical protein